jgi:hypothetical protein
MKRLLFGTIFLALVIVVPIPTMAQVDIRVSFPLPPPIVFVAPPELIVLPETYVYVDPDIDADLFFWSGWWWRLWEGRWYRSHYYDQDWGYYQSVPSFYVGIPSGWRNDYREHRWGGRPWNYQRIPHQQLRQNWVSWQKNRYWEKQGTWGVQGLKSRTVQQPKQVQQTKKIQQPKQVQQQQPKQVQKPKQIQQPKQQPQEKVQQPQRSQPQGRPEGREVEHGK